MKTKLFKQTGIFCLALATALSAFGMKETRKKGKEKNDSNQLLTYSSEDAFGIS
jgi:hypothetical protein